MENENPQQDVAQRVASMLARSENTIARMANRQAQAIEQYRRTDGKTIIAIAIMSLVVVTAVGMAGYVIKDTGEALKDLLVANNTSVTMLAKAFDKPQSNTAMTLANTQFQEILDKVDKLKTVVAKNSYKPRIIRVADRRKLKKKARVRRKYS